MKHIKLLLAGSLLVLLFLRNNTLHSQGIKDKSLYFWTCNDGLPDPYRKGFIDTLNINFFNQDTITFKVGFTEYLKVNNQIFATTVYGKPDTLLIFDYNLVQGDSISIFTEVYRIDSVRNVKYFDGEIYKEWHLNNQVVWIENLGSNSGWNWWAFTIPECTPVLGAICHNNELIYWDLGTLPNGSNPEPTCNFDSLRNILSVSNITNEHNVRIYPNPVSEKVLVQGYYDGEFEIRDQLGKTVMKGIFENSIDVRVLKTGIYQLIIKSNGINYTSKIIKL